MNAESGKSLVLVADDDPGVRILLSAALEAAGFDVVEAADGREALAYFHRDRPDLVILDVNMPLVNGFDVCSSLRSTTHGSHKPVLIMTGLDDLGYIERAFEVGATDFITKPIHPVLLGHRVKYLIRESQAQNEIQRLDRAEAIARSEQRDRGGPIETTVLDAMSGLLRDGKSVLSQVITAYMATSPPLLDRLSKAAAAGDYRDLLETAHALKSSSANVGARNLAELCRELEEGARSGEIPDAEECVAGIQSEYNRVHVALMAELDD
ncbi:MAG: response regulator [Myxococcota bacterium]